MSQRAMCQLFSVNMSEGFWVYAVKTAVYLINCSLTTTLKDKTPFEAWTGKQPNIKHLCTFGETGYVHIPPETRKKWTKKLCPCHLISYIPRSRSYKMWDPNQHTVVTSPNVIFNKSSTSLPLMSEKNSLHNLSNVFDTEEQVIRTEVLIDEASDNTSKWESDGGVEIPCPRVAELETILIGPDLAAPLIPKPNC